MTSKIIFMGTPEFSVPSLKLLNLEHKVLSVYTQPPRKKSRGQKIIKSAVHVEAENLKLPIRFPENLNNESDYKFIKDSNFLKYSCIITSKMERCCSYSKIYYENG